MGSALSRYSTFFASLRYVPVYKVAYIHLGTYLAFIYFGLVLIYLSRLQSLGRIKFDPLINLGTSKVFYELLSELKTTKEISEVLKIRPPSVTEHLRRLQEIGIIQLGKKKGKFQDYEINYQKFLILFIERAIQEKKTHPSHSYPDENQELRSLRDNKHFAILVKNYLQNQGLTATIDDSAKEFEDSLLHSSILDKKKQFHDVEKQDFFDKMKKWKKIARKKMTYTELNFQDALARTLDPDRFNDA